MLEREVDSARRGSVAVADVVAQAHAALTQAEWALSQALVAVEGETNASGLNTRSLNLGDFRSVAASQSGAAAMASVSAAIEVIALVSGSGVPLGELPSGRLIGGEYVPRADPRVVAVNAGAADPDDDLSRIRLVVTLLETCGQFFEKVGNCSYARYLSLVL